MGVSPSPAIAWIIGLGWIVWNIAILAYAVIICSRYIFAQAFDRVLPAKFAYVSERYGSPVYGLLMVFVITVIFMGLTSFLYGTFTSLYGTWILGMCYFALVGIVAVIYAVRNEKGGSKALLSVSGILMAAVFLFLAYQFIASPEVWGGNPLAYGYILAGLIIGAVIYVSSWQYHKKKGINISLAFKQIPPE
jgi:amino acid transporter